jgi:hypothetical protein
MYCAIARRLTFSDKYAAMRLAMSLERELASFDVAVEHGAHSETRPALASGAGRKPHKRLLKVGGVVCQIAR